MVVLTIIPVRTQVVEESFSFLFKGKRRRSHICLPE